MAEIDEPSIKQRLWHSMRADLARYAPDSIHTDRLMCCCCGRFLPYKDFSLEHLIPRQAFKLDPVDVRDDPSTPANVRAKNLLLCTAPLTIQNRVFYGNGCNSWKGKFYDANIRELMSVPSPSRYTQIHILSALCLAYLGLVEEYGYRIVLMTSGVNMRQQFFMPQRFHKRLPITSQMLLRSEFISPPVGTSFWSKPFTFTFERDRCIASARNFGIVVPIVQDPRVPLASRIIVMAPRYTLRPDFTAFFS